MKLKLDENLGRRAYELLDNAGFDVSTVVLQKVCGASDPDLIELCSSEGRCLVTLDLDFSNPLQFPPNKYAGIVVLRLPKHPSADDIGDCLRTFIRGISLTGRLDGTLRIISKGRIREYSPHR
jgi:predicted nuclease of predicted toxin-antitoxin system